MTSSLAFLGLGDMGRALAHSALRADHSVTVWNRSSGKDAELVAAGARSAADVADAVAAAELIVVCLLDDASVRANLEPVAEQLRGKAVVNLTTSTPGEARELAKWAQEHGIRFVDGGIMAVPPMIGTDAAFILFSGDREAFDAHAERLAAFGEPVFAGTDPGAAALQDLALLTAMYGMFAGALQSLALVRSAQPEVSSFVPLLQRWIGAMAGGLPQYAAQIDAADYTLGGVVSNLAMQAQGDHFGDLVREQGLTTNLLAPLTQLMKQRVADGHGHEDLSSVVELLLTRKA
ncbi:NAD(P)-binding domain-containing protein [Streptomyces sp. T-3]|nr:NAD(P)-binding domain-containing protein [Streptomyces sp. T-3]